MTLPNCPRCGAHDYQGGGGSFGGDLSHSFHWCPNCLLGVFEYRYNWGQGLLVYVEKPEGAENWRTPEPLIQWLNGAMIPTWKECAQRIQADNDAFTEIGWDQACDTIDIPRKTKFYDMPKGARDLFDHANDDVKNLYWYCCCQRLVGESLLPIYRKRIKVWRALGSDPEKAPVLTRECWRHDVSKGDLEKPFDVIQAAWDCACEAAGVPRLTTYEELPVTPSDIAHGVYDEHAKKWQCKIQHPYPPQAGDALRSVYQLSWWNNVGQVWVQVCEDCSSLEYPKPDPCKVQNAAFFRDVWAQVSQNLGVTLPYPERAKNEYGGIEDWYTFTLNGTTLLTGWQHRVINVEVTYPNAVDVRDIRDLAKEDSTTYEAEGALRTRTLKHHYGKAWDEVPDVVRESILASHPDGRITQRKSVRGAAPAERVVIHAWNKGKLVEYLTILLRKALNGTETPYEAQDWSLFRWANVYYDHALGVLMPTLPPVGESEKFFVDSLYAMLTSTENDPVATDLAQRIRWDVYHRGDYCQSQEPSE